VVQDDQWPLAERQPEKKGRACIAGSGLH